MDSPEIPGRRRPGTVYHVRNAEGVEGVLKRFKIPRWEPRRSEAVNRLKLEVDLLVRLHHPNIVKLLDANIEQAWIVMEYLSNGTLAAHLLHYEGDAVAALRALRPLLEGVAILHHLGIVHRDIKLQNIFVAEDGRLVLGDFGVAFDDRNKSRITTTNERVGSRDWTAPWADVRQRVEKPNPKMDVFPLGKVLWCMLSGFGSLPFWYHQKDTYDLALLFQDQMTQQFKEGRTPQMAAINWMLDLCIVENEKDCRLGSARELLNLVDSFLWAWTGPAEPGRLWEYYSVAREQELYDGVDQDERELLLER